MDALPAQIPPIWQEGLQQLAACEGRYEAAQRFKRLYHYSQETITRSPLAPMPPWAGVRSETVGLGGNGDVVAFSFNPRGGALNFCSVVGVLNGVLETTTRQEQPHSCVVEHSSSRFVLEGSELVNTYSLTRKACDSGTTLGSETFTRRFQQR